MSVLKRFWVYQSERFPLKKTVPLLLILSAASLVVSATLSGRGWPGWGALIVGFGLALSIFFQMRICDEFKDAEDDRKYRPNRPLPRGLVSPRELIVAAGLSAILCVALAWSWAPGLLWLLCLVWAWLAAMTFEFGAPAWLRARPVLYLVSHMLIVPLITVLLTGVEWWPHGAIPRHLWLFFALAFCNGAVLEIGRKLWAPENEIAGVETYSGLWGHKRAAMIWAGMVAVAFVMLVALGAAMQLGLAMAVLGGAMGIVAMGAALRYASHPDAAAQDRMDTLSGLWVFACYALAGGLPVIMSVLK